MAGLVLPGYSNLKPDETVDSSGRVIKKPASSLSAYDSAVNTQGSDYDRLMSGYQNESARNPIAPVNYSSSPDVSNALSLFKNFSATGGYSDQDINSLRERAISPIRSIYANAKSNLDRQRVISGGYSPGYAGSVAKMARESSNLISGRTNDANANIAQMVQAGKLAAMSPYANLASSEAGRNLDTSKFNAGLEGENRNRSLDILKSQSGLYGTSPALIGTLGNQALSANSQNIQQNQFNTERADRNRLAQLTTAGRL